MECTKAGLPEDNPYLAQSHRFHRASATYTNSSYRYSNAVGSSNTKESPFSKSVEKRSTARNHPEKLHLAGGQWRAEDGASSSSPRTAAAAEMLNPWAGRTKSSFSVHQLGPAYVSNTSRQSAGQPPVVAAIRAVKINNQQYTDVKRNEAEVNGTDSGKSGTVTSKKRREQGDYSEYEQELIAQMNQECSAQDGQLQKRMEQMKSKITAQQRKARASADGFEPSPVKTSEKKKKKEEEPTEYKLMMPPLEPPHR